MRPWSSPDRLTCSSALAVLAALSLAACAGAPPAPAPAAVPAPGAAPAPVAAAPLPRLVPTEPPVGLGAVERFAWQRVMDFGAAFAAGDAEGFLSKVSRGFYRGYSALEVSLKALLSDAVERNAVVAVRRVTTEDDRVTVRAQWTRSITRRNGIVQEAAGETEFLFFKNDTSLRLLDYRGDPPFAIEGI